MLPGRECDTRERKISVRGGSSVVVRYLYTCLGGAGTKREQHEVMDTEERPKKKVAETIVSKQSPPSHSIRIGASILDRRRALGGRARVWSRSSMDKESSRLTSLHAAGQQTHRQEAHVITPRRHGPLSVPPVGPKTAGVLPPLPVMAALVSGGGGMALCDAQGRIERGGGADSQGLSWSHWPADHELLGLWNSSPVAEAAMPWTVWVAICCNPLQPWASRTFWLELDRHGQASCITRSARGLLQHLLSQSLSRLEFLLSSPRIAAPPPDQCQAEQTRRSNESKEN